jgi:hypothetical protein
VNANYKPFFKLLDGYEAENGTMYMSSENELIFEKVKKDPETLALIESLKDNSSLKNPIDWLYFWVKGEIYDLKALSEAISLRELVQKQI